MNTLHTRRQSGFALLEALVAMLVMAFGMLAIASFQMNLSRSSDLAKQRAEPRGWHRSAWKNCAPSLRSQAMRRWQAVRRR
ncbi:MAG: hypothetical protein HC937_02765 [Aquincola sp.]|nr:hypothetical protein [Aquincola sp.]